MQVSIVINVDNRVENNKFQGNNLTGVVDTDFLIDGIENKRKFFSGYDYELIIHVDKHTMISADASTYLCNVADRLLIRSHTHETNFNCYNYLRALELASGEIVCHIDQDTACFTSSSQYIDKMIEWANEYSFVSYPSYWSPRAVHDESFGNRTWASTRFFICKREALKFDELRNCIIEPEWGYAKYGDSNRRCNWLEHYLTLTNNDSCLYPPMDISKIAIFSWGSYRKGLLKELNEMNYEQVQGFITQHPIVYPCDIYV